MDGPTIFGAAVRAIAEIAARKGATFAAGRGPVLANNCSLADNSSMIAKDIQTRLQALGNPKDAAFLAGFFKTGPGQYGEGDSFIGVRVPVIRNVAKDFKELPLPEVEFLLHSPIHEERLAALVILVMQAARADTKSRKAIYDFYLANTKFINNWDLVDVSAPQIVGAYLADNSRKPLYRLATSSWLWDRRISILATFHFIRGEDFDDTLRISEILLADREDLMHKAVGWMLREVGKRDVATLEAFLGQHCRVMPRTMLRYAIERFSEKKRRAYMGAKKRPFLSSRERQRRDYAFSTTSTRDWIIPSFIFAWNFLRNEGNFNSKPGCVRDSGRNAEREPGISHDQMPNLRSQ